MNAPATASHAAPRAAANDHGHSIPLWGLFLALLALTAAEVALFEVWSHSNLHGTPFMPKYAMVLLLLAFTFPKAAIVMIYFMHLKFEKQLVVLVAIAPFAIVPLAVLVPLTDAKTLKAHGQTYNLAKGLGAPPAHSAEGGEEGETPAAKNTESAEPAAPAAASPATKPAGDSY